MNVQSIWTGEYYAFQEFRPNKQFPMRAIKGKAVSVEKRKEYGKERASAYVYFETEDGLRRRVRARDVVNFWDDYVRERDAILKGREEAARLAAAKRDQMWRERQARQEKERKEREEAAQREQERVSALVAALTAKTNLPKEAVTAVSSTTVSLDRTVLEFWLSN